MPAQHVKLVREAELQGEEKQNRFEAAVPAVHVIAQEQVVGGLDVIGDRLVVIEDVDGGAGVVEESHQVAEVAIYVPEYLDRPFKLEHNRVAHKYLLHFIAEPDYQVLLEIGLGEKIDLIRNPVAELLRVHELLLEVHVDVLVVRELIVHVLETVRQLLLLLRQLIHGHLLDQVVRVLVCVIGAGHDRLLRDSNLAGLVDIGLLLQLVGGHLRVAVNRPRLQWLALKLLGVSLRWHLQFHVFVFELVIRPHEGTLVKHHVSHVGLLLLRVVGPLHAGVLRVDVGLIQLIVIHLLLPRVWRLLVERVLPVGQDFVPLERLIGIVPLRLVWLHEGPLFVVGGIGLDDGGFLAQEGGRALFFGKKGLVRVAQLRILQQQPADVQLQERVRRYVGLVLLESAVNVEKLFVVPKRVPESMDGVELGPIRVFRIVNLQGQIFSNLVASASHHEHQRPDKQSRVLHTESCLRKRVHQKINK